MVGLNQHFERYMSSCFLIFSVCACCYTEGFPLPSAPPALSQSSLRVRSRLVQIPKTRTTITTSRALGDLFEDITTQTEEEERLPVSPVPTKETEPKSSSAPTDSNGNAFVVGCTVLVCKDNLHMYQVGSKSTGSFEESGLFVADPSQRYLALPIGLQGTVIKVYKNSENNLSANLPVRVEFRPTAKGDCDPSEVQEAQKLDPPSRFTAHFATNELDCVV